LAQFKRLLLITDIPNPYRIPLFNALAFRLQERGVKLKVIFGSRKQEDRLWEVDMEDCLFDFEVLPSRRLNLGFEENTLVTFSGLMKSYNAYDPDKTIVIGYTVATIKLWWHSLFRSLCYNIWSGSIFHPTVKHSFFRMIQRKIVIKRSKRFLVYGTKAKEYLVKLGAKANDVFIATNTVDIDYFSATPVNNRQNPNRKKIGVLSYLIMRKGLKELLDVIKVLSKERNDFVIEIVGDGVEREQLEAYVKKLKLEDVVIFLGFKQKQQIPKFLASCDLFLFQTHFDCWGLVLIEAMAVGIPVIASKNAAATNDIVQEGETGMITDFCVVLETVKKINFILDNPDQAQEMGAKAKAYILENCTLDNSVDGFIKMLFEE
jgi:glycosyltransferase involved in cell wall biosynthesis